jgi:hypothetical protein
MKGMNNFQPFFKVKGRNDFMNDQLKHSPSQAQGSNSSEHIDPSLPSYLLEAALDKEWERRHRQGDAGSSLSSNEEDYAT